MQDYIERKIDINGKIDKITVKQFDNNSRYLHVVISDADCPDNDGRFNLTDCTAALYTQPAGDDSGENVAYVAGEVADGEEGIVTFLLPGSVTQVVGDYECEIWIYEGSSSGRPIISGQPFMMTVQKSIRNTSVITASPQFSALDAAMSEVRSLRSEMNAMTALADAGEIPAGTVESEVVGIRVGWDGYGYDSAGDAVRNQLRELHDSMNRKFIVGKNVFNPETVLLNYTLDTTDGTLVSAEGAMVSDKIWRHGAAYAVFSYLSGSGTHAPQPFVMVQYRADDSRISFSNSTGNGYDAGGAVELDNECAYIRFCTVAGSSFTDVRERIMVELSDGNTMSDFEPYHMYLNPQISVRKGLREELKQVENMGKKFIPGKNVFDPAAVLIGYTLNTTTGALEASAGAMVSDRIETGGAGYAAFSYLASSSGAQGFQNFPVFQYDADGRFLSVTTGSKVALREDCACIRFSASATFAAKKYQIMAELTDTVPENPSPFERYRTRLAGDVVTALPVFAITSRLILSPATVKIKLLGDSITFGKSSTGSDENGEGFLTYERTVNGVTETVTRRRSLGTHSWAAMLKAHIEATYNATVTNNAVSGWRTDEVLHYWNQLIDGTEDIVIVMLGTNNRTKENGQWLLYNDLQTIKDTVEANGGEVIFMSAPPAGTDNENREDDGTNGAMQFHMNDVDDIIAKFAADNHREYISLYKRTLRYMEDTGTPITDLLVNELSPNYHLHPNDRLHALMFGWVMDGLGLSRKIDGATW